MYQHWIYDNEVAESIYHYCNQPHIVEDMRRKFNTYHFSLLEYVVKYQFEDFKDFTEKHFGYTVFLDLETV